QLRPGRLGAGAADHQRAGRHGRLLQAAGRGLMGAVEDRLAALGLEVPAVAKPVAAYVPAVRSGNHVFTSGQIPVVDGTPIHLGKGGAEVTEEQGIACARQCALNAIAAVKAEVGDLDLVKKVVKVVVFVASAPDFTGQPKVANG